MTSVNVVQLFLFSFFKVYLLFVEHADVSGHVPLRTQGGGSKVDHLDPGLGPQ